MKKELTPAQMRGSLIGTAKNFSEASAVAVFLIGILVLIGWKFDISLLKSISSDFVSMKPNTALGLVFLGMSLWFLQEKRVRSWTKYLGWSSAVFVIFLGVIAVLEHITGLDFGINSLLFQESGSTPFTAFPGRMAINTAFCFIFFGMSLLYLNIKTKNGLHLSVIPAVLGGLLSLVVIVSYFYDLSQFYFGAKFDTLMALHTALSFFLMSLGILFARPESRIVRVFVDVNLSGVTVRRLFPLAFLVPIVFIWLEEMGNHYGFYSQDFGMSVTVSASIIVFATLILLNAILVEKKESARLQAQEKLAEEKKVSELLAKDLKKFQLAVDSSSDHIMIVGADGKILYCNKAVESITGYAISEMIGKTLDQVWGGHMSKEFYVNLWHKIKIEKKMFVGELTNYRKDGTLYTAEVRINPILYANGDINFFVGVERDITKTKEVDKMKSEFISLTSHQLSTPLTAIKWYIEILLKTKHEPEDEKNLRQVYASNERMIRLVSDLLDVSRIESGTKFAIILKPVDMAILVRDIVETALASVKSKHRQGAIKLEEDFPESLKLEIDENKIRQVFQNFVDNAINYSEGRMKISVGYREEKQKAIFYVKDVGIGIPKAQQSRVFEKFFRADNTAVLKAQGTGLGLYLSKAIVEGHGGKIWFESEEGVGSTFYFSLPLNRGKL